jgi:hypothetical protein
MPLLDIRAISARKVLLDQLGVHPMGPVPGPSPQLDKEQLASCVR